MTRILLSIAALVLVAVGAFQVVSLQECAAISTASDAPEPVLDLSTTPLARRPPDLVPALAQPPAEPAVLAQNAAAAEHEPFSQPGQQSSKRTIKVPRTTTVYEDQIVEVEQVTPLQQQYSVLMLKRAQRMTEEELKSAIEEVESELKEQDDAAATELQKAIDILNELKVNSSGTPAARRAESALPILNGTQTPAGSLTHPTPVYADPSELRFEQSNQPLNAIPTF